MDGRHRTDTSCDGRAPQTSPLTNTLYSALTHLLRPFPSLLVSLPKSRRLDPPRHVSGGKGLCLRHTFEDSVMFESGRMTSKYSYAEMQWNGNKKCT
ncbi:hypothetical protein E2C01_041757 [Portunus trituberculatus]|uniref:Uncharacterized protein n=1 Tax=Portunus trituberculatus TaxID=210409 RepID=A0A5B7FUK9_PORTR|nr:hypothetical protein [Portunus trituberculatus]